MYEEIQGILLGNLPSKWPQQELAEVWNLMFRGTRNFNKKEIKYFCQTIKANANLLRHPDPEDKCPAMWVSILLFTSFKKLPLFLNHPHEPVKAIVRFRLE